MALISAAEIKQVTLFSEGRLYLTIEASAEADTSIFEPYSVFYSRDGWFRAAPGGAAQIVTNNVYAKVNGSWVNIAEIYLNVNGTWRRVTDDKFYVKTPTGWKS